MRDMNEPEMTSKPPDAAAQKPSLDTAVHGAMAQFTGGLSPAALLLAGLDWRLHLWASPQKQLDLAWLAYKELTQPAPAPSDKRFRDPAWDLWPFSLYKRAFLSQQTWWDAATTGLKGVEPKHEQIVNFLARQSLDMLSPTNWAATNPKVIRRTGEEQGRNLMRGAFYWMEDLNHLLTGKRPIDPAFRVGETLATTPGDVVLRNRLVELIRYRPTTKTCHPEPILIVPAWIMKYYVLDLSEHNSLVRYLRDQGFEVYILSWKNPDADDADLGMEDYFELGISAAIKHLAMQGKPRLHAVGYCLGGTLLATAAAALARDGDQSIATLTMLASQVDFSDPGELGLFINESQIAFLEDLMVTQGYLKAHQMAGAFQMLRSNDLIWSRVIRHYLLGERSPMNDLMAWNADATRMPVRMHSEYLRGMFLRNQLAKGRYKLDGDPVALSDIRAPIFCLATEADHISPWPSVYKLGLLTDTDVTFVLTNGGHNGGVLSEPGHEGRYFRRREKRETDLHVPADTWIAEAQKTPGSWWPVFTDWLRDRSTLPQPCRARPKKSLGAAPGDYVRQ